ncbi:MAG: hypothetical protein V8R40_04575 [Dysosmobacter sp.]
MARTWTAPALTAYIVSIPVFGDITTILCSNIANVLGKRKHISMSTMATFTQTGLNLTHAMVPPRPVFWLFPWLWLRTWAWSFPGALWLLSSPSS